MWYIYNDELCHYGTKGMKWKKRKKRALTQEEKDARKRQDKMNSKVSDIERKARLIESAERSHHEARYAAEYGPLKSRRDQKIANKNTAHAADRLRKERKAYGSAVKEYSDELSRVQKNRKVIKRIGKIFTVRKKKDRKTGTVTTTRKVKNGTLRTTDHGSYKSTKYIPKNK